MFHKSGAPQTWEYIAYTRRVPAIRLSKKKSQGTFHLPYDFCTPIPFDWHQVNFVEASTAEGTDLMIMEQVIKGLVGWGPCHHLTKGLSNYTLGFAFFKYVRFFLWSRPYFYLFIRFRSAFTNKTNTIVWYFRRKKNIIH